MANTINPGIQYSVRYFSQTATIDEHVTFKADWVEFRREKGGLVCSLQGEFLQKGESLSPPMPYSMVNIGVCSEDLGQILGPVYEDLKLARKTCR